MDKTLALLKALMAAGGDMLLSEAIDWVQVKENAEQLLKEGHEDDAE